MIAITEDTVSAIVTTILTVGCLWLFYPAWAVLVAERVEWEIEQLSSDDTQRSKLPVLSVVIPAYNEQDRINEMICESFGYLSSPRGKLLLQRLLSCSKSKSKIPSEGLYPVVEWLIVNDGSSDSTCDVVRETYKNLIESTSKKNKNNENKTSACSVLDEEWKIVSLKMNSGKGAAVRTGMNLAKGMFHLMVDADGATTFGLGLENLTNELIKKQSITAGNNESDAKNRDDPMLTVFGSRAHLEKESTAQRSFVRTLLMKAFHFFVSLFVSSKVHDTQCGFKLFSKSASDLVFQTLHLRRWAFDTEIVLLCDKQGIEISEVAVPWKEVDGSKLSTSKLALAVASISMLRDMICVRACYMLGIWSVKRRHPSRHSN